MTALRRVGLAAVALGWLVSAGPPQAAAQQQTVDGTWSVNADGRSAVLTLRQQGQSLSGHYDGPDAASSGPVTGSIDDRHVRLVREGPNGAIHCEGHLFGRRAEVPTMAGLCGPNGTWDTGWYAQKR